MVVTITVKVGTCALPLIYFLAPKPKHHFHCYYLLLHYRVQAFLNSDQNRCAMKLLSAYEEGDAEGIKQAAQSSAIKHLDHVVIF